MVRATRALEGRGRTDLAAVIEPCCSYERNLAVDSQNLVPNLQDRLLVGLILRFIIGHRFENSNRRILIGTEGDAEAIALESGNEIL